MQKITGHFMGKSLRLFGAGLLTLGMFAAHAETAPGTQPAAAGTPAKSETAPQVVFQTTLGDLKIALAPEKAPVTVENFLHYVDNGFYNGVIFHRVVPGFVVQGGGFDQEYQRKTTQAPIANESHNGLQNLRGTLSMARTGDPNSATAQFFINLRDNAQLDGRPGQPGYAVFGKLVEGLEVIDAMAEQPQGNHTGVFMDAPNTPIVIVRAYRYHPEGPQKGDAPPADTTPKAGTAPANTN